MTSSEPILATGAAPILIVEDEEILLASMQVTLSGLGYRVVTRTNALEGLRLIQEEAFSLILTDQRMPGMSGLEFLAQVKKIQPEATRVLMTGVLDLGTIIESINNGEIYRFLVKPWLPEELFVTVRNSVQRYELLRRNTALHQTTLEMNKELGELNTSLQQQMTQVAQQNQRLAWLNRALEQNLHQLVALSLNTLETFYPMLGTQARRTAELCQAVAEGLALSTEKQQILEFSAYLHDIGLVGVPRRLIRIFQTAPSRLNIAERKLIQQHPVLGQELVGSEYLLKDVGAVIRAHHERFDGSGFPDGLAQDEIPWLSRLLAVAAFVAETPAGEIEALETVRNESGSKFDPEAVRALLRHQPVGESELSRAERQILLAELQPGMVLAKGIYTPNGLLLIPEGQVLNERQIDKLRNHNRVTPIRQSLVVYG